MYAEPGPVCKHNEGCRLATAFSFGGASPRLSRRGLSNEVFPAFGGVLTRVDGPAEPRCAGRNGRPGPGSGTGCAYYAYNIYV